MFLIKKDWKQHAVSILALGSLIFVGSVMSYLVATNFFGWDNRSDLLPFYLHASDFVTNFMSLYKLTFLLTAFGIGWLVNWTTPHCAKYQSKRKDKFNTAWELEISTGAVLTTSITMNDNLLGESATEQRH